MRRNIPVSRRRKKRVKENEWHKATSSLLKKIDREETVLSYNYISGLIMSVRSKIIRERLEKIASYDNPEAFKTIYVMKVKLPEGVHDGK